MTHTEHMSQYETKGTHEGGEFLELDRVRRRHVERQHRVLDRVVQLLRADAEVGLGQRRPPDNRSKPR